MMRSAFSILLLAAALPLGAGLAVAQGNPRLKTEVTVADDVVRIGDLIENAGIAANTPIFRAPDLGQRGAVPARAVIDAVRRHGLIAVDTRGLSEISVTHASQTIAADDIEQRIAAALAARYKLGTAENIKILFDREVRPIQRALNASAELAIARVSYDASSRRFDVSFEIPAERQAWRYTGSAVETVEVAVVTRVLNRGDLVKASDF